MSAYIRTPALCVDLDGTVRGSKSCAPFGPTSPDDVVILPGVEARLRAARDAGEYIVGITNQGVIGYGTLTTQQVVEIIDATRYSFTPRVFDAIYYSPSLPPTSGGKVVPHDRVSLLRKPHYGMLVLAEVDALAKGIIIDWAASTMVGDRAEDFRCAERAGIAFTWAWQFFGWPDPAKEGV